MNNGSMEIVLKNKTSIHLLYDERLIEDIQRAYNRQRPGDSLTIPVFTEQKGVGRVVEIEFLISELDKIKLVRSEVIHFGETVFGEKVAE